MKEKFTAFKLNGCVIGIILGSNCSLISVVNDQRFKYLYVCLYVWINTSFNVVSATPLDQ